MSRFYFITDVVRAKYEEWFGTAQPVTGGVAEVRQGLEILAPIRRDSNTPSSAPTSTVLENRTNGRRKEKRDLHEKAALDVLHAELTKTGARPKLVMIAAAAEVSERTLRNYRGFKVAWDSAGSPPPEKLHGIGKRRGRTGRALHAEAEEETK